MTEHNADGRQDRRARARTAGRWVAGALLAGAAAFGLAAHAQGEQGGRMGMGMGMGPEGPPGMAGWGGGPPEAMVRGLDRMLDGLGVTDDQRSRIHQIALAAAADLRPQRDAERALHQRGIELFTAPTVDAGAAEQLRQQVQAQQDQAGKRRLQAMLDIAQVLTPEQRARIGARLKEREAVMKDRMQRMEQDHARRPASPPQR